MASSIVITVAANININTEITATTSLIGGTEIVSASSKTVNGNEVITLVVSGGGEYRLRYDNPNIKSWSRIQIPVNSTINISARWVPLVEYTICIDEKSQFPHNASKYSQYLDDAAGMTRGSADWDTKPIFEDIKPCVFQNGQVNYYLNPNDFTKKVDGSDAVLTGADGDVMIEFSKFAYKIKRIGHYLYVSITNNISKALADEDYTFDAFSRKAEGDLDRFYQGAFKGWIDGDGYLRSIAGKQPTANQNIAAFRAAAQNRNNNGQYHYQQSVYSHIKAIQCLYLIKYGDCDAQNALGVGITGRASDTAHNVAYATGYNATAYDGKITGTMNVDSATFAKGMCYGSSNDLEHIKLFGIEDFYGNIWEFVDGLTHKSPYNIITSWNSYSGEDTIVSSKNYSSGITSQSSGWIKKVAGTSQVGFIPIEFGAEASATTCWHDKGIFTGGNILLFGGQQDSDIDTGVFYTNISLYTFDKGRYVSGRLTYC